MGVRLRIAGGQVRPHFVSEPGDGDEVVVLEGISVFVARAIVDDLGDLIVDVTSEHGNLTVRSA